MNAGANTLGLPKVPGDLAKETSNLSTTSLEKQLKEVDQKRGQFITSGANNFGDCSQLLQEVLGANNHAKTGAAAINEFEGEAFPLLSKDNSAMEAAL